MNTGKSKKNPNKNFSKHLKQLRKNKDVTQNELSVKAKIDYRHYQDVEAGRVNITFDTIATIAAALEIKPCYLLNFESNSALSKMNIFCSVELLSRLNCGVRVCDTEGNILYCNSMLDKKICGLVGSEHPVVIKIWDILYENSEKLRMQKSFEIAIKNKIKNGCFHTTDLAPNNQACPVSIYWNSLEDNKNNILGFISIRVPRA